MPAERLQKIIAAAGIASRRKAEQLIAGGLVSVNGQIVTELGSKADPESDHIRVNGKLLRGPERAIYLMMNKPKGYVTTLKDPEGRPTIMQLLRGVGARVYPVGRLDYASEGLLLLTNDGELANGLMKAASHVPKVYLVKVAGVPSTEALDKLRAGVSIALEGGKRVRTAPARIRPIREGDNPWFEVTLIEGKNRQIRKMFEEVGHHVEKIRRVKYGPLALDVPPGEIRRLTPQEVNRLKTGLKKRTR
jgi:23S rRNA pseudouridine2605 synthase